MSLLCASYSLLKRKLASSRQALPLHYQETHYKSVQLTNTRICGPLLPASTWPAVGTYQAHRWHGILDLFRDAKTCNKSLLGDKAQIVTQSQQKTVSISYKIVRKRKYAPLLCETVTFFNLQVFFVYRPRCLSVCLCVMCLFVPSPGFWTVQNQNFLPDYDKDLFTNYVIQKWVESGPPSPFCQSLSAFAQPPLPPLSANISISPTPPPPFVSYVSIFQIPPPFSASVL